MNLVKVSLRAAALLAALALARPAGAVNACGDQVHEDQCGKSNIYPCCENGGNCTWWAWESVCRSWHVGLVNWGNANTWAGHAQLDPDYDVLSAPVVGSIATSTKGTYGHVAWVVGVSGSTVTVTEENCCSTCAPGMRSHAYQASYFNSGYVVRHGVTCACSPGDQESQACGDCGTRTRTCDSSCSWGGWGACGGPDPEGGQKVCATSGLGPCAEGRVRCVDGNTTCKALVDPSPEACDGVDNDCNGEVDDGHPALGEVVPEHAAELVDVSYPQVLHAGERALVWAELRNVGTAPWPEGGLWLAARGGAEGGASALYAPGAWPAWDVAAVIPQQVLPGEIGRVSFEIEGPDAVGDEITERFQLRVAGGDFVGCPRADFEPTIRILPAVAGEGGAGGALAGGGAAAGGCAHAPASPGSLLGGALALALLALARRSRR